MLEKLKQDISLKLSNADYFKGYELPEVEFSVAPVHTGADISMVWALSAAKKMHKNPMEIAKEACVVLREITAIADAEALPPGFINLKLEEKFIIDTASDRRIKDRDAEISKHNILIEFVSANPYGDRHDNADNVDIFAHKDTDFAVFAYPNLREGDLARVFGK